MLKLIAIIVNNQQIPVIMVTKITYTLTAIFMSSCAIAQTDFKPEDTEFYSPKPPVVSTSSGIPSDAIALFNGSNLNEWESSNENGGPASWTIENNILKVKEGAGGIQTKQKFEDFQLHVEWKSPEVIKGEGQGRGNSGIFLQGLYEIQVLDNNNNPTYVNGQAGSLYKQRPPLVEVHPEEGAWHTYDIIYKAPRFNKDGMLISKGNVTLLHNGILVQNNTQIEGTTEYIGLPKLTAHGPGPIALQDHGNPVSFKNIWIRTL